MIPALLTIIGLVIAFWEKITLFKKPITFTKVIIIGLLITSAAISLYKDYTDSVKHERDSAIIDSLNSSSHILNEQISYLRKESKISQREYSDSLVNYHNYTTDLLAKYGYKIDTLSNSVRKFDTSIKREVSPTLTIIDAPSIKILNNEKTFEYDLSALNADVHLIGYYYVLINIKNGLPMDSPYVSRGNLNYTTVIPKGSDKRLIYFIERNMKAGILTDTFDVAMEFIYKSKQNNTQTPLRKVYEVIYHSNNVKEANSNYFYQVALYLRKNKIWKKFYNL